MKKYVYVLLVGCLGFAACQSKSNRVKNFIPGSYVSSAKSEFSIADDTLVITADKTAENTFMIVRKTGYRLLSEGKPGKLLHKIKRWTATWDKDNQQLTVLQTGKAIRFLPDRQCLVNGSSTYRKL